MAAVRLAVRRALADLPAGSPVGVALSGGPDSLALLAGAVFGRPGAVRALVVDHGWYEGSAQAAASAAAAAGRLGAAAEIIVAHAPRREAAAREARYAALAAAADRLGLATVLLGHTRDDQAEAVLLGLARGSGARSLAGMAARRDRWRRPLLELPRAITVAACVAARLEPYDDPANADRAFVRARVRHGVLPALAEALGHDVAANLARSARLLRDDADLLDGLADAAAAAVAHADGGLDAGRLAELPPALRRRLLHRLASGLTAAHVDAAEALVTHWHGQGPVGLPGGGAVRRTHGRIHAVGTPAPGDA